MPQPQARVHLDRVMDEQLRLREHLLVQRDQPRVRGQADQLAMEGQIDQQALGIVDLRGPTRPPSRRRRCGAARDRRRWHVRWPAARRHLEAFAHGIDVTRVGEGQRRDDRAAPRQVDDEALSSQVPQGVADRPAADLEEGGQVGLDQARAGRDRSRRRSPPRSDSATPSQSSRRSSGGAGSREVQAWLPWSRHRRTLSDGDLSDGRAVLACRRR